MEHKYFRYLLPWLIYFATAIAYGRANKFMLPLGPLQRTAPEWWLPEAGKLMRHISWVHIDTGLGLLILSLPFALGIALLARGRELRVALIITGLYLLLGPMMYLPFSEEMPNAWAWGSWGADVGKKVVCLPLLTYVLVRIGAGLRRATSPTVD